MFKAGDVVECVDDVGLCTIKIGDRYTVGAAQGHEVTFDGPRYSARRFKLHARIIDQNATNEIWEREGQHSVRPLGHGVVDSGGYTWQEPGTWELGAEGFRWLKGAWKGHQSSTWQPRTVAQPRAVPKMLTAPAVAPTTDPYVEVRRQLALKLDTENPELDVGTATDKRPEAVSAALRNVAARMREHPCGPRFPVEGRQCRVYARNR